MAHDTVADARAAHAASRVLRTLSGEQKDQALEAVACELELSSAEILAANQVDMQQAEAAAARGELKSSLVARLKLTDAKLAQMLQSLRAVMSLPDPSGRILLRSELQDGLELQRVTCPFGVLAAIIEARPDAVTQIVALALKSGNALLLKAGAEAASTTQALMQAIRRGLRQSEVPENAICNVVGREAVKELLGLEQYIDLVVPRGGNSLVQYVKDNTRIPVMGHADGVCHIFVDQSGQQDMALRIIRNAKVQAPSTCNAVETVLVHQAIADQFLPKLAEMLRSEQVKVRGCERTRAVIEAEPVNEGEWHTEYGDLTIAIRVVDGVREAIDHINQYGSKHTDSIISEDRAAVARFMDEVDSAGVFHNASTRFSDGYQYGFGAEVGISTSKLHARGPVGLDGLVTYKYKLFGSGQVRG